jgi:hypothetical protein
MFGLPIHQFECAALSIVGNFGTMNPYKLDHIIKGHWFEQLIGRTIFSISFLPGCRNGLAFMSAFSTDDEGAMLLICSHWWSNITLCDKCLGYFNSVSGRLWDIFIYYGYSQMNVPCIFFILFLIGWRWMGYNILIDSLFLVHMNAYYSCCILSYAS